MNEEKETMSNEEVAKEVLDQINKDSDNIHIHKTREDGSEVNIDVDKKNKAVEINIDNSNKEKGKEKVNVTFSGVHVKSENGEEVKVNFLPWIVFGVCFATAIIGLVLFTIYNIFKLFV